jgi:prolyl-tRNA editing enzyme YbaK/EbsC (Cys-tRNA(Pro) deacylase)
VTFTIGKLEFRPAASQPGLLALPVTAALTDPSWWPRTAQDVGVAEIDPGLADTAAFCERYGVSPAESANCVVIAGKRDGAIRFAACVVLATTRADVNGVARRALDVRKASFAATDVAVAETSMEYGGITPIGLPAGWPVLVDAAVAAAGAVVIGSGVRRSKLAVDGPTLADIPGAVIVEGLGR